MDIRVEKGYFHSVHVLGTEAESVVERKIIAELLKTYRFNEYAVRFMHNTNKRFLRFTLTSAFLSESSDKEYTEWIINEVLENQKEKCLIS